MLSFKPTFSLSSFTFIKRPFSSSSLSTIRVMSSANLRLLIFLLAILILACASYTCQNWSRELFGKPHYFANKGTSSQSYGFSSSHVWIWESDYKETWALKNCCFWTVVLEKMLQSPLDCKEIQPVHLKGNQSWIFTRRADAKAETLILWPPDAKNWLIWKDSDSGKDWRQEE